jgi:hypothetical protein
MKTEIRHLSILPLRLVPAIQLRMKFYEHNALVASDIE